MKKRGNAGKRKINWSAFTGWFVLLSLVAAMIYIIVVLVLAPSHTQIVFERANLANYDEIAHQNVGASLIVTGKNGIISSFHPK